MQVYADNVFIRKGENTWFRLFVAHDCETKKFETEQSITQAFKENGLLFRYESVQEKKE